MAAENPGPPAQWDRLDADPPLFASRGWLTVMGHRLEGSHRYFIDTGARTGLFGSVIADSAVTATKNPWDLLFDPLDGLRRLPAGAVPAQASLRAAAPARSHWFPALVLTYPGLECYPIGPDAQNPAELDRAVSRVVATAHAESVRTVAFMYVQPRDRELAAALGRAGFVRIPTADHAILHLPGSGFDDYLRLIGRHGGGDVWRIRRRLAESGVSMGRLSLRDADDGLIDRLVELRNCHRAKYGKPPDTPAELRQLRSFRQAFGKRVTIYTARAGEYIIGFSLFVDAGAIHHCWLTGADYADPRAHNTYFEMCYHTPIEAGYQDGVRAISFSYGAADIKRRRGCALEMVYSYVLALDPDRQALVHRIAAALG